MTGELQGVRVLDFTWYAAGPIATKYLADNGATVVKVESMVHLDNLRNGAPWKDGVPGYNRSQFFGSFNSSKKSITINMSCSDGQDLARRLVPHFDVVADSFSAGAMDEWGMGYDELIKLRPDLIQVTTCMQGQDGPHSRHRGFGTSLTPLSGFDSITGYSQDELSPPFGAYTDFVVPRFLSLAILSALDYRNRTGKGQLIDLSQYETALHFLAPALTDFFLSGRVMHANGNRSDRFSPHGSYRCLDEGDDERWIALAIADDSEWSALLKTVGVDTIPEEFASQLARVRNPEMVDAYVGELVSSQQAQDLTERLQAVGVSAYPVQSCLDLRTDENLYSFGFWPWLEQAECGPMPYDGLAYRLCRTPGEQTAAPSIGQHNDDIFRGLLRLTDREIAQLTEERVIY